MQASRDHADIVAPPPLLFALPLVAGYIFQRLVPLPVLPSGAGRIAGVVVVAAALALLAAGLTALRRARTSPVPVRPTTAIVTDGPYRFTRNPLYLGFVLLDLGIALFFGWTWALVLLPIALVVVQKGVIEREERYLEGKFGDEYRLYKTRVRRWI